MKWISEDSFQVSENTPVRTLRGRTKRESKAVRLMLEKALKDRRRQIQKSAEDGVKNVEEDVKAGVLDEKTAKEFIDSIRASARSSVRVLSNYIDMGLTQGNIARAVASLTIDVQEDLMFEMAKLVVPELDREKEYDSLTDGEGQEISERIEKLSHLTRDNREDLGFLSDSPAPSTGNGLAKSAGNSDSTPKGTVTE